MLLNKYLKNNRGITLVELLAVIVIGSILIILISNIHVFGHKQSNKQSEKSASLFDVSYAAKVITKEIRKAETVKVEENILTLNQGKANQIIFKEQNKSLLMNNNPIVNEVSLFIVQPKTTEQPNGDESIEHNKNILELTIKGKESKEAVTTEIFIRGENLNE